MMIFSMRSSGGMESLLATMDRSSSVVLIVLTENKMVNLCVLFYVFFNILSCW